MRQKKKKRTLAKQLGDRIATLEALELLAELLQGDQLANAKTILREALSEAFAYVTFLLGLGVGGN